MENYIVSARKYRPTSFGEVVGQQTLTQTLKNAIRNGKLAHAYLFCGPRGVGKTTCARIFAKTINCLQSGSEMEACGVCESCKAFDEGRSFTIHELDAASNNSVEDIRALIDQVQIPPQVGKYKVFIIDEVHMLSSQAFNAFLKTLEEPPTHAIFILATTEKHKILPTILSRCQIYDFKRMEVADIVEHLKGVAKAEGISYEEQALGVIAQKADGGMRDALSIFDQVASFTNGNLNYAQTIDHLNVLDSEYFFRIVDEVVAKNIPGLMLTLNEVLQRGFDAQHFIGGLAAHLRDLLVASQPQTVTLIDASDETRQRYVAQAQKLKPNVIFKAVQICNDCDLNYRASRNKRLLVEITLIELAQLSDDGVSSGRKPRVALKPIFKKAAQPVARVNTPTPVAPKQAMPSNTIVRPPVDVNNAPAKPVVAQIKPKTFSLRKQPQVATADSVTETKYEASESVKNLSVIHENQPFTKEQLGYCWRCFLNTLPKEYTATVGRLKNVIPEVEGENRALFPLDGEFVVQCFNSVRSQAQTYLKAHLKNSELEMSYRIIEQQNKVAVLSQREQWKIMLQKNRLATMLKDFFELELN